MGPQAARSNCPPRNVAADKAGNPRWYRGKIFLLAIDEFGCDDRRAAGVKDAMIDLGAHGMAIAVLGIGRIGLSGQRFNDVAIVGPSASGRESCNEACIGMMTTDNAISTTLSDELSPAFQPGSPDITTILVLAAPGRDEQAAGRPAAGRTGVMLDELLSRLHGKDAISFPSPSRLDYRIMNAVTTIMYGVRSLPTKGQIREARNVERLKRQLAHGGVLVALGPDAVTAILAADKKPTFCSGHPGMQGVNQLPVEVPGSERENTSQRLDLFASLLLASRGRCAEAMLELTAIRRLVRAPYG